MNIIPKPNGHCELQKGCFPARDLVSVNIGEFDPICLRAFEARTNKKLEVASPEQASLLLVRDTNLSPEGYTLRVGVNAIVITASAESGAIWALATLHSLQKKGDYPALYLEDAPKYAHRGFSLDCARHFFPVQTVKEIIELNSLVKLNVLHWHLCDDQGWRIESKSFPKLHQTNGQDYFTQDEIRDIVAFAKVRGVEVIPEIDMPGHTSAVLAAYPELSCMGEPVTIKNRAGIFSTILCGGDENTYTFIKALLDEIYPLFDSPYFHIGGDEAPKTVWEKCPKCQAKLSEIGSDDFEDLQGHFLQTIAKHLGEKGKIPFCWSDTLTSQKRPNPLVIQQWLELGRPPLTKSYIEAGGLVVFSDMFCLYLDYPEAITPLSRVYHYSPALNGTDLSDHPFCLGIEACVWCERITSKEALYQRIYPRLFAVAEAAWTNERNYANFRQRLAPKLAEMAAQGLPFFSLNKCNPTGVIRTLQVLKTLKILSNVMDNDDEGTLPISPDTLTQFLAGFDIKIPKMFLPSQSKN
jgi:N-acetyl-beta-hexosaminidase